MMEQEAPAVEVTAPASESVLNYDLATEVVQLAAHNGRSQANCAQNKS